MFKEADSLKKLKHKNIIKLLYSFPVKATNSLVIVMEYARGGELKKYMKIKKCLDEKEALLLFL